MRPSATPSRVTATVRLAVVLAAIATLVVAAAPARAVDDRAEITITYATPWPGAAKTAFRHAADIWETMIFSDVPIEIEASWVAQNPGQLGSASPNGSYGGPFPPGLPRDDTWYPVALANELVGFDINGDDPEIVANFNSNLTNWDHGIDGNPDPGKFDFVTVVMHELGHGLGFGGFMYYDTVTGEGYWTDDEDPDAFPGVYDRFTATRSNRKLLTFQHGSVALGNQLTSKALYWAGPKATAYNGAERPRMYAPATWAQGTSYGHVDETTYPAGNDDALMTPYGSVQEVRHNPGPIVLGMFEDMGWQLGLEGRAIVGRATILKARLLDASISSGDPATVRGTLTRATTGAPIANKAVRVFSRPVGTTPWTLESTQTTNAQGKISYADLPADDTQYQLRYLGNAANDADISNTVKVVVTP